MLAVGPPASPCKSRIKCSNLTFGGVSWTDCVDWVAYLICIKACSSLKKMPRACYCCCPKEKTNYKAPVAICEIVVDYGQP